MQSLSKEGFMEQQKVGQDVETVQLPDGSFRVLWFDFNKVKTPPPTGATKEEALEKFKQWHKENYYE